MLNPSSPIYPLLSQLALFNLSVGDDNITCDFDWKHVQNVSATLTFE